MRHHWLRDECCKKHRQGCRQAVKGTADVGTDAVQTVTTPITNDK